MKNYLNLVAILFVISACSNTKNLPNSEGNVGSFQRQITKILDQDSVFNQSHTGLVVTDLTGAETIFNYKGSHYFTPASNTKLLTFYTALNVLDEKIVGLKYSETKDSIIIWGTGDPSFLNPKLEENNTLSDFLRNTKKQIYFSSSNFMDEHYGSGWSWDDYNYGYQTEKNSLPMYGNLVNFSKPLRDSDFSITPEYFTTLTQPALDPQQLTIMRDESQNQFLYDYYKLERLYNLDRNLPFRTQDETIVQLLSKHLGKEIKLANISITDRKTQHLRSVRSDSLYKLMLQPSDNFVAEQLLLNCASELFDTLNTRKIINWSKDNLLSKMPHEFQWVDGSGLSRYNMITPENMVHLLSLIYGKVPEKRLFDLLPTAGESGTIRNLYEAEKPFIHAKTGSLRNNHSLSGYLVGDSGKVYIFSLMNSNYVVPNSELKGGMDRILRILKENL